MTPAELFKIKFDAVSAKMKNKKYLYDIFFTNEVDYSRTHSSVMADNDLEAISFTKELWGTKAKIIRKDHWGKGPIIKLGG